MSTIKPPQSLSAVGDRFAVFLAGSIEMGFAENWQEEIENAFAGDERICFLNPRRDAWDASWKQEIHSEPFNEQVNWELDGLERADLIVFYFAPGTKSPVSLLELGLFADSKKLLVCCPEGFWRKGNVDIVCWRKNIPQVDTIEDIIRHIGTKMQD